MQRILMQRDRTKGITGFGVLTQDDGHQLVLMSAGDQMLVVESDGLTEEQAALIADGYVDGLRAAETLTPEMIDSYLNNSAELASLEIPLDISLSDRELVKLGLIGGLQLAAEGFWLDMHDATFH